MTSNSVAQMWLHSSAGDVTHLSSVMHFRLTEDFIAAKVKRTIFAAAADHCGDLKRQLRLGESITVVVSQYGVGVDKTYRKMKVISMYSTSATEGVPRSVCFKAEHEESWR